MSAGEKRGKQGKIGIFDSGFGGLHTLRGIRTRLPTYDYLYLGDSARAPYGPRTADEIRTFSIEALEFLFAHGCELVIFACNTASSDALHSIQETYLPQHFPDKKVLGVLIPLSEEAVAVTMNKRIGIIATEGTVGSGAFVREIHKLDPSIEVFQQAAPKLVPLIEVGTNDSPEMQSALLEYLEPLMKESIDTLILGCTHYGFAIDAIRDVVGTEIKVVSESHAVPSKLVEYLERHRDLDARLARAGTVEFFTTGEVERFNSIGSVFLGQPLKSERVVL